MAEDESPSEGEAGSSEEGKAKGGKKKLIIIIAAAVVLLGGGGAAFFMMSGSDSAGTEVKAEGDGAEAGDTEKKSEESSSDEKANSSGEEKSEKATEGGEGDATKSDDSGDKPGESQDFGEVFGFKPFSINLGNPLENHYIKLDIALQYFGGEAQKVELEKKVPQMRDAIISVTSRKSKEFLLGPDGKDQLRREILIRLNRHLSKPVEAVYITDIMIE